MSRSIHKGMDQVAQMVPFSPQGKIFIVGESAVTGYDIIVEKFGHLISNHYTTIDAAIDACTASRGDVVLVAPGHSETISAAGGIAMDKIGVSLIGIGVGSQRPTITFDTATTADMDFSADNVLVENFVFINDFDALVEPLDIAASVDFVTFKNCEFRDDTAAKQTIRWFQTADTNTNIKFLDCKHVGSDTAGATAWGTFIGGSKHVVKGLVSNGDMSAANIEIKTTLTADILIDNCVLENANAVDVNVEGNSLSNTGWIRNCSMRLATDGEVTWVNNVGGITVYDSYGANANGEGGRSIGTADAGSIEDDLNTILAQLSGAAGIATFPSAAAAANAVSLAEVVRYIQDQIITGTGTVLPTNTSLYGVLAGATGIPTFPSGVAAANDVSMAEVLRYTQENVINGTGTALPTNDSLYGVLAGASGITTFPAAALPANSVSIAEVLREAYDQSDKAVTNTTATLVNATTLFTIAGGPIEILSLVARCVTTNDGTASTLQWNADPTDGVAVTISGASASLASVAAGGMVVFQGTTLATAPLVSASGANIAQAVTNGVVVGAGIITSVIGVGSTTGTWQMHMRYRPLARGVTVT